MLLKGKLTILLLNVVSRSELRKVVVDSQHLSYLHIGRVYYISLWAHNKLLVYLHHAGMLCLQKTQKVRTEGWC